MDMSETGFAWLLGKLEWKIEFYHVSQSSMEKVFFFFPKSVVKRKMVPNQRSSLTGDLEERDH